MDRLLTQADLAERWQVSTRAITNWREEGKLQPAKGVPVIRFAESYIAKLEGIDLDAASPLVQKRMAREIKDLKAENEKLKGVIARVLAEAAEVVSGNISKDL